MTKVLLFCILSLFTNIAFATPEFTPKEATDFIDKSYEQVKNNVLKKGYSFSEKDGEFYYFEKVKGGNKYTVTLSVKQGKVTGVGTNEHYEDYTTILKNLQTSGFTFSQGAAIAYPSGQKTEFTKPPTTPIPSSITRLDKQKMFICSIVCPFNLKKGANLISINYGVFTP